jgi:transcriptional regulator with XRE-family HTH domain
MTQVELAKRLKKPQSFVSAYESGKRAVKVDEFIRIAREVGADPKKLFSTVVKKS